MELFNDNGKPVERQGRKAKGPVKWQPSHRKESFFMKKILVFLVVLAILVAVPFSAFATSQPLKNVDTQLAASGLVNAVYEGNGLARIRLMVQKDGIRMFYDLRDDGEYESFPLQMGSGKYRVAILENIEGTRYRFVYSTYIDVQIEDENSVYLNSVQNINWNDTMVAIEKAAELTEGLESDTDKINVLYNFMVDNFKYDYEKLETLESTYVPDIEDTIESGKGICYDYSALFAAMLRSQGIPTKLVKGYTEKVKGYHAWNEVYNSETGKWMVIDTTYDSQLKGYKNIEMEKAESEYEKVYEY